MAKNLPETCCHNLEGPYAGPSGIGLLLVKHISMDSTFVYFGWAKGVAAHFDLTVCSLMCKNTAESKRLRQGPTISRFVQDIVAHLDGLCLGHGQVAPNQIGLVHADHVFPLDMLVLLNNVGCALGLVKFEAVLDLLS